MITLTLSEKKMYIIEDINKIFMTVYKDTNLKRSLFLITFVKFVTNNPFIFTKSA